MSDPKPGDIFRIEFHDPRQPEYTRYSGEATYVGPDEGDYDTGELHHKFTVIGEVKRHLVSFPESSVFTLDNRPLFPENKSMSDPKPILAKTIWDAFPDSFMLDCPHPDAEATVEEYVAVLRSYAIGVYGGKDHKSLGGDSVFQYVMLAACDAKGDGMQFLADLIRGAADLNSVAQGFARKLKVNSVAQGLTKKLNKEITNEA